MDFKSAYTKIVNNFLKTPIGVFNGTCLETIIKYSRWRVLENKKQLQSVKDLRPLPLM